MTNAGRGAPMNSDPRCRPSWGRRESRRTGRGLGPPGPRRAIRKGPAGRGAPPIRDNVPPREASAPRRRARRPRDAGARRDGRRRDVPAQARDPTVRRRPRRHQRRGARVLGLGRVRRRGARPRDLHRRGRALVLPLAWRGRRSRPVLRERVVLYLLLTLGGLFPLGYLVYGAAVLEMGRDAGIELAERWILTPLGVAAIAGLVGLWLAMARRRA